MSAWGKPAGRPRYDLMDKWNDHGPPLKSRVYGARIPVFPLYSQWLPPKIWIRFDEQGWSLATMHSIPKG